MKNNPILVFCFPSLSFYKNEILRDVGNTKLVL